MRKKCCVFGIFAHVDAGKTTFTEQLLYQADMLRKPGSVDEGTTVMDAESVEKCRGITVFADQGYFTWNGNEYFIIDTPGHADFAAEAERVMGALDYAILLVSGTEGVQAHTVTLFRLLASYQVPVLFFINKMDNEHTSLSQCLDDIRAKLTEDIWCFAESDSYRSFELATEQEKERGLLYFLAEREESFLEEYLSWEENGAADRVDPAFCAEAFRCFQDAVKGRKCFPVFCGSALKGFGIASFLENLNALVTDGNDGIENSSEKEPEMFQGLVYQIRHDDKAGKLAHIKVLQGILHVRDELQFMAPQGVKAEKVSEIRRYQGKRYVSVRELRSGQVGAVAGLRLPCCGDRLEVGKENRPGSGSFQLKPVLRAGVFAKDQTEPNRLLEALRILMEEEPALDVSIQEQSGNLLVHVMGNIQLEILEFLLKERFGIEAGFKKPEAEYLETIRSPVIGYGHFEPLRHYAEVKLRLEPSGRGSGVSFSSECHVDVLSKNFQRLVETHVFEKEHKGILTGSAITDIRVVLLEGRSHLKHTEGGDFREAVYRAIRQGLEKADNLLLEPMYHLEIYADLDEVGHIMADIQKRRGVFQPPEVLGSTRLAHVEGRGPAAEFMDYAIEFSSYTGGKGSLAMTFDGYDICSNTEEVIERIGYDKERDLENTSTSVFCAKGAAFTVKWDEAEAYMHCR